jgi:hypothetical protein
MAGNAYLAFKNSEMRWHTVGTSRASQPSPWVRRPAGTQPQTRRPARLLRKEALGNEAGARTQMGGMASPPAARPPGRRSGLVSFVPASRRCQHLPLSEALALQVETGLLLGRNRSVKAARDVPAKGTPEGVALADALGRTPAPKARRIVDAGDDAHGRSLRRRDHAKRKDKAAR